jgi:two-component system chemotaxis response regulator CheB
VIGVVLSGNGRDGAYGCKEIKEKKGVTISQDEKTSAYFAMPDASIRAGVIDYVLPLDKIAVKIVALIQESC